MPEIFTAILGGEHPAFAWMGYEHYDSPAKRFLRDVRARGAEAAERSGRTTVRPPDI